MSLSLSLTTWSLDTESDDQPRFMRLLHGLMQSVGTAASRITQSTPVADHLIVGTVSQGEPRVMLLLATWGETTPAHRDTLIQELDTLTSLFDRRAVDRSPSLSARQILAGWAKTSPLSEQAQERLLDALDDSSAALDAVAPLLVADVHIRLALKFEGEPLFLSGGADVIQLLTSMPETLHDILPGLARVITTPHDTKGVRADGSVHDIDGDTL